MWPARQNLERPYEYLLKVIVVGDSSVGKSCLLLQFVDKRFRDNHEVTVGVEFGCRIVEFQGLCFKMHVWDTAGQESFRSITRSYYRTAAVALLVFDITKRHTFEHLREWIVEVLCHAASGAVLAVVANKIDLEVSRQVSRQEGEALAAEVGALYFETSAREALGVDDAFIVPCVQAIEKQASVPQIGVHRLPAPPIKSSHACCHR